MKTAEIKLQYPDPARPEKDRFFVLGDNSAQSSDGRLWVGEWWVERELLIGKALFIYWPHGWEVPSGGGGASSVTCRCPSIPFPTSKECTSSDNCRVALTGTVA